MLKALREEGNYSGPCALLLGGFDGLHAGHQSLVAAARKTGLPMGATLLSGNKAGGNLFTFAEREYIFGKAGFAFVLEEEFTEDFRRIPAEEYLGSLFSAVRVGAVFCGEDYRFGRGAAGNAELLKKLAPCPVTVLPLAKAEGKKVSVSGIKRLLRNGEIENANRLLGGYFIEGTVEHGRGVGRTLGFPTANLSLAKEKTPPLGGVYGGMVETDEGEFPAVVNVGARPTFGLDTEKIEAHLKGFSGDLYGKKIRVFPTEYLRPIQKFSSEEELKIQLEKDIKRL